MMEKELRCISDDIENMRLKLEKTEKNMKEMEDRFNIKLNNELEGICEKVKEKIGDSNFEDKKNILKINENMNMNMRQIANRLQRYDYDMRRQNNNQRGDPTQTNLDKEKFEDIDIKIQQLFTKTSLYDKKFEEIKRKHKPINNKQNTNWERVKWS